MRTDGTSFTTNLRLRDCVIVSPRELFGVQDIPNCNAAPQPAKPNPLQER
jgi:hypothetical protein